MNKKKTLLLAVVLIGILAVGSTLAFLTDKAEKPNTFTIGSVDIDLLEPAWNDETSGKNITPKAKIAKDPQIENVGKNDAYVFLEVEIPKVLVNAETVTKELFTTYNTTPEGSYNTANWYLLPDAGSETTNSKVYVYAYATSTAMTKLSKETTTPALFNGVELIDFDSLGTDVEPSQDITVRAYAIQADNIGATAPADVWAIVKPATPAA